jgi:amidase
VPIVDARASRLLESGSIADIGEGYRSGAFTVAQAVAWYLARIAAFNEAGPALNAVKAISPDALADAQMRDHELAAGQDRGPLHGIPVLIKANVMMGPAFTVHAGVAAFRDFRPRVTAEIVTRLRAAGAVILGQTNMTEFADYVSDIMPAGFSGAGGVVRNPHGVVGYGRGQGSSVGSASAVAAGFAPLAVGGETQNSIQTPASYSSVVGFKPSKGAISRAGIMPLVPSQDAAGFIGRSVTDVAIATAAVAGADLRDAESLQFVLHRRDASTQPIRQIADLRIGVPRRAMADREQFADVMPQFAAGLARLEAAGATIIDPCDLPSADALQDVRSSVFATEFKASLNTFLEDHDPNSDVHTLAELIAWNDRHPETIPYGQSLLIAAEATLGINHPKYIADKRRDLQLSQNAGIDAALLIGNVDVLIAPMGAAAKCTGKAGAPTLAIPFGLSADGTPFGMTLYARWGDDAAVLSAGTLIEALIGDRRLPTLAIPQEKHK